MNVVIIGAGLSGLAAALDLVERGARVTVLEAGPHAGGKAGSNLDGQGGLRDYGLHIFPGWYVHTRDLLARAGASSSLVDHDRVGYLPRGGFPHGMRALRAPTGVRNVVANLARGPLPWADAILYHYFVLDMIGRPVRRRRAMDRISLMDFF